MVVPMSLPSLSLVEAQASAVLPAPLDLLWPVLRSFQQIQWLVINNQQMSSQLMPGDVDCQLGAVRCVQFGDKRLFEQLVALDDHNHTQKWKLVSHPLNINPLPASFVNYQCTFKLLPITMSNKTLIQWEGQFYTEPTNAEAMKDHVTTWYEGATKTLIQRIQQGLLPPPKQLSAEQLAGQQASHLAEQASLLGLVPASSQPGAMPSSAPLAQQMTQMNQLMAAQLAAAGVAANNPYLAQYSAALQAPLAAMTMQMQQPPQPLYNPSEYGLGSGVFPAAGMAPMQPLQLQLPGVLAAGQCLPQGWSSAASFGSQAGQLPYTSAPPASIPAAGAAADGNPLLQQPNGNSQS